MAQCAQNNIKSIQPETSASERDDRESWVHHNLETHIDEVPEETGLADEANESNTLFCADFVPLGDTPTSKNHGSLRRFSNHP